MVLQFRCWITRRVLGWVGHLLVWATSLWITLRSIYSNILRPSLHYDSTAKVKRAKGSFGCNLTLLNLNWKSGRKNAFLPDLTRVCGPTSCTDVCNLKPSDSNEELKALFQTDAKTFSSEASYGIVANFLAYNSGVLRAVRGKSKLWGCAAQITPNQRILNWIWGLQIGTERPLKH